MNTVNIAIIGTGFIAHYHARALLSLADVNIAAIIDTKPGAAQKFADNYNLNAIVSTDTAGFVNREDIDAVIIGTPNKFHLPYAIEFLNHGKDVFLEKPMALNTTEGKKIMETAISANRLVMVGHMWRFDEEVMYMKEAVVSGKLGKIIKTKGYGIHENWGPSGWFTQKQLAGGGALIDMGVHAIDTTRFILDDPKPLKVYAEIGTFFGDYDVDDTGIIIITWDNGATSIIESGWWQPHMDGPEAATRLFGIKGYASVFPTFLKIKDREREEFKPAGREKTEHCDQSIYTSQMKYFIDCIRTRKKPSPGLDEGLTVLKIVDAAYRSASENKVIAL